MLQKRQQTLIYVGYILVACILGGVIFAYEMHINSEPLLKSTPIVAAPEQSRLQPISSVVALSLITVRTEAERELGLGGRSSLPANTGMLFIFPEASNYGIWMKDMQFPIDIISLDANFSIVHIEHAVAASTYPEIFYSPASTTYIIEANAGYAAANNLAVGQVLYFVKQAVNN